MTQDSKTHFLLKIPMGTRNNFSEIYQQFGRELSKRFASPDLVSSWNLNDNGTTIKSGVEEILVLNSSNWVMTENNCIRCEINATTIFN
jgi:hypothetical protein